MTSRALAATAAVLIVAGVAWLSLPWALIVAGILIVPFVDLEDL